LTFWELFELPPSVEGGPHLNAFPFARLFLSWQALIDPRRAPPSCNKPSSSMEVWFFYGPIIFFFSQEGPFLSFPQLVHSLFLFFLFPCLLNDSLILPGRDNNIGAPFLSSAYHGLPPSHMSHKLRFSLAWTTRCSARMSFTKKVSIIYPPDSINLEDAPPPLFFPRRRVRRYNLSSSDAEGLMDFLLHSPVNFNFLETFLPFLFLVMALTIL